LRIRLPRNEHNYILSRFTFATTANSLHNSSVKDALVSLVSHIREIQSDHYHTLSDLCFVHGFRPSIIGLQWEAKMSPLFQVVSPYSDVLILESLHHSVSTSGPVA
jgi:hypothetical protein